ncbi:unnamed protein product [Effrenium voratum]|uniref:TOG domain-containing protein n=1 Tax=Effrenium voratum TaxID=2562239 RepID=A0AA36IH48_9DINO|nr:unnamed protein product [Effrenium voratum]
MGILRQLSFWKRGNSKLVPFDERSESRVPEVKADLKSAFSSCDTRLEVQRFRTSTPASSPSESTCSGASESPADAEVEPSASGESAAFSPFDLVDFNASQQEISRAVAHEFGEEVASSLQSTKWDKRLRSLQSISSMLAGRDLEGGKTTKSRTEDFWEVPAWRASCLVLHQVLRDKVIPVNLAALELFRDTFEDLDEAEPEVRHAVGVLIDQVTSRLGDSNVRLHEAARRDVVFAARLLGLPDLLRRLRSRLEEAKGNERNKVHFGVLDTVSALLRAESGWAVEDITGFITLGLEETSGPRIRKAAISLAETVYRLRGAESAEVLFANLRSAKRNLLRQRFEEVDEEQRSEEGGEERPDLDDFLCAAPIRALASASASAALPGAVPQGEEESLMDGILEETGLVFQGAGIANERRGRKSVSFCQFPDDVVEVEHAVDEDLLEHEASSLGLTDLEDEEAILREILMDSEEESDFD